MAAIAALLFVLAIGAFWPLYLARPFTTIDRYTQAHAAIGCGGCSR